MEKNQRQKKSATHTHIHIHTHTEIKQIFGIKSEILIKDKRIKWTPSRKASHLLPEG